PVGARRTTAFDVVTANRRVALPFAQGLRGGAARTGGSLTPRGALLHRPAGLLGSAGRLLSGGARGRALLAGGHGGSFVARCSACDARRSIRREPGYT